MTDRNKHLPPPPIQISGRHLPGRHRLGPRPRSQSVFFSGKSVSEDYCTLTVRRRVELEPEG
jgi:hypothetical protein